MSRPWFKFYGRDFRDGVAGLSLEEVGAYTIMLTLLYECGGLLADDERTLCHRLGCDVRVWRRLKTRFIETGKLTLEHGQWTNARVTEELTYAELVSEVRRKSGRSGGQLSGKSRAKVLESKKTAEANAPILLHPEGRYTETQIPTTSAAKRACGREPLPAEVVCDAIDSPFLDLNKGNLGATSVCVGRWVAAGADLQLDVIPTVRRIVEREARLIPSWNYFTDAVREATAARLAPVEPIQPAEAFDGQRPDAPAFTRNSRRPVSATERIMSEARRLGYRG